jgi:hypothetical protein
MTKKISWSFNIQVAGGPRLAESNAVEVEAYDDFSVSIDAGSSDKEIELQPGGAGQTMLLVIRLENVDQYGTDVSYKVNNTTATPVNLDAPHLFIGNGAVGVLDPAPNSLFFTNGLADPITVQLLIGRDVTP